MASTSVPPRRSTRSRRPPPRLADAAMASTSARPRSASGRRRLQQPADRAAASTSARRRSARGQAARAVLPDDIWEDIFLRLDAAADLARASAACSTFRCIISERRFLRRFRSLRSPPVLGFISSRVNLYAPVDPPHRSASQARALEEAADFTFSFLPEPADEWCFRHARDGRVLLARRISPQSHLPDLVVCDPLYRRYVEIPRIPDDLLTSAAKTNGMFRHLFPILAPAGENDEKESFRVICTVQLSGKVVVFIFSSCNQTWRVISTTCLPRYGLVEPLVEMPCYAHGCVHWMLDSMECSLMLDTSVMEFSVIDLPPYNYGGAIVEAEEGRLGLLTIGDGRIDLYYKNWQNNGAGAQVWQHEKLIPLPKDSRYRIYYHWRTVSTAGHYVALLSHEMHYKRSRLQGWHYNYFVLNIKTLLLEELCTLKGDVTLYGFPYARFPPPLALPSIRNEEDKEAQG